MAKNPQTNIPTIIVVFGATGDLMQKKISPALYHLFTNEQTPDDFKVVGVARREYSDKKFQSKVYENLKKHKDIKTSSKDFNKFLDIFSYTRGEFQEPKTYISLKETLDKIDESWGLCTNKLFYLAVPPKFYETIFNNLSASGLTVPCSPKEGWTRVLVEKPFGDDLKTAKNLENQLATLFKEEQIFRIDHYLAKEMLQNILAVRFSNNLFEQTFNNNFIESIEVYLHEKMGAEGRGHFYDNVGTLKDVGQNHLLQMLSLATMDQPLSLTAKDIRTKRLDVIKSLRVMKKEDVKSNTFRAQYKEYKKIKGVKRNSKTETYFKLRTYIDNPRWEGVPITIESGKGLASDKKQIVFNVKHTTPCLCPEGPDHYRNKIVFNLSPQEGITIDFWSKKPGLKWQTEKRELSFDYRSNPKNRQYTEEYEKLLYDCIVGDQTLFVSTKEVLAMWKFIDPIVEEWGKGSVDLVKYDMGSNDIVKQAVLDEVVLTPKLSKEIGIVGLGKMGGNLARQLISKGYKVHGLNRSPEVTRKMKQEGLLPEFSIENLVKSLPRPRVVWLMVPAGDAVDQNIDELLKYLDKDDIIIDGGNSFYKNTIVRAKKVTKRKVRFLDCGVSGGPRGALNGACLMIGGQKKDYQYLRSLFVDLSVIDGEQFFEGYGAGHFVKMVHNGIEYGMMQSIAEGFSIMQKSGYRLHLKDIAEVYNHGSVIESRLIGWMANAFEMFGDDLKNVSGSASHSGEGLWTTQVAHSLGVPDKVIHESLNARIRSQKYPNYQGKIIQALRNQFGGHNLKDK